jgi:glyoxylase-like metal-dependent hydrolase (beta-lactamase superfamily II)
MFSYLIRQPGGTMLFPGDTLFHGGLISLQATHDCDPLAYAESLRRLAAVEFDMMFPGHGLWSLSEGHRHIDAAMKFVDGLLLPPSL